MQWPVHRDDPASSLIYAAAAASRVSGPLACRRRAAPTADPTPPCHTQRSSSDARTGRTITAAQPHLCRAPVAHSPPPLPCSVTPTAARMRAESAAADVAAPRSHHSDKVRNACPRTPTSKMNLYCCLTIAPLFFPYYRCACVRVTDVGALPMAGLWEAHSSGARQPPPPLRQAST
jgi:hypothetical protein